MFYNLLVNADACCMDRISRIDTIDWVIANPSKI